MADTKTTALTELTTPALSDIVYVVDDTGGTPISKKISLDNLMAMSVGQVYTHEGVGTQTPGTSYAKVTQIDSDGISAGSVTVDAANNKITAADAGLYFCFLQMSFSGTGNSTWDFIVYCNGVAQNQVAFMRKLGSGGDVGSSSAVGIIDVTSGPMDIEVYAKSDGASDALEVKELQLFIARIGPT